MKKTNVLIVICFFASFFYWYVDPVFVDSFLVFRGSDFVQGKFWTVVTSLFFHGDLVHLVGNMIFLYAFGNASENEIGAPKTLGAFSIGGVLSFIFSTFFYGSEAVMIGASAAIFTVMAVVMLTKPLKFSWLFFMPLGLVAILYLLFNVWSTYYAGDGSVGYIAHMIGFLVGLPFGIKWSRGRWVKNLAITILIFFAYLLIRVILGSVLRVQ